MSESNDSYDDVWVNRVTKLAIALWVSVMVFIVLAAFIDSPAFNWFVIVTFIIFVVYLYYCIRDTPS
jgi:hypothetical protein